MNKYIAAVTQLDTIHDANGDIKHLARLRRNIASTPQRFADEEAVILHLTESVANEGMNFLAEIHAEIDNTNIHDLRRHVSSNPQDTAAKILLAKLALDEMNDEDNLRDRKRRVASAVGC